MLTIVPCDLKKAQAYVKRYHRHNGVVTMARFALAVADDTGLIHGVAITGNPDGFNSNDGFTAEIKRVCTDGYKNACSMLYTASWKAAKAMGYRRIITYTLPDESQSSLKAVGWMCIPNCGGRPWSTNKNRKDREVKSIYLIKKNRWETSVQIELAFSETRFPEEMDDTPTLFDEVKA